MAGKAKSVYLTVTLKGEFRTVFHKVFFDSKSFNDYVKTEDFMAKYPTDTFDIIKETY